MENAKMNLVRFDAQDVIATSDNFTGTAYQLAIYGSFVTDACAWYFLNDKRPWGNFDFHYVDGNGTEKTFTREDALAITNTKEYQDKWTDQGPTPIDYWFHYEDGVYYLCEKNDHHAGT